jgi:hypothetical protein
VVRISNDSTQPDDLLRFDHERIDGYRYSGNSVLGSID